MTQDRLAERRFVERGGDRGRAVARGPVRRGGAGRRRRSSASRCGSSCRPAAMTAAASSGSSTPTELDDAWERLGVEAGDASLLAERELEFAMELSVIVARAGDGSIAIFPIGRNVHDAGILVETGVAGSGHARRRGATPSAIGSRWRWRWTCCGTLTVGALPAAATTRSSSTSWRRASTTPATGRSRAPRPRSSSSTSGRSAGWASGRRRATGRRRWSTCSGPDRDATARLLGVADALADPAVHLHLYDKRAGLRTPQDGAPHGARDRRRTRRSRRSAQALTKLHWADDTTSGGRPMTEGSTGDGPVVGVVGGSRSDFPTLEAAVAVLDGARRARRSSRSSRRTGRRTGCSATPRRPPVAGIKVIIAGAGGAAHLPGMLAAKTALPVIGVPIPTEHLGGLDSLLSIVQMPRGVPVATVGIGNATNAGLLAAAILATSDAGARRAPRRLARPPDPGRPRRPDERLGARRPASHPRRHRAADPDLDRPERRRRRDEQPPAVGARRRCSCSPPRGAGSARARRRRRRGRGCRRRPRSRCCPRHRRGSRPRGPVR